MKKGKQIFTDQLHRISAGLFAWLILISCGDNQSVKYPDDTTKSGTINISVDESFKPIIDSQIKVFESSYPEAKNNYAL